MKNKFIKSIAMATAFVCMCAIPAFSQNLVTNGGFEAGNFSGWTQFGDTTSTGVCTDGDPTVDCSGFAPHSGDWMGSFGAVFTQGGVYQTLATSPGTNYLISFYLSNGEHTPNSYSIDFGGVTLVSGNDTGYLHWQFYQFTEMATSSSTTLSFAFYQVLDYYD